MSPSPRSLPTLLTILPLSLEVLKVPILHQYLKGNGSPQGCLFYRPHPPPTLPVPIWGNRPARNLQERKKKGKNETKMGSNCLPNISNGLCFPELRSPTSSPTAFGGVCLLNFFSRLVFLLPSSFCFHPTTPHFFA